MLEESAAALQARVDRLHTDAEIERLAREQHNLVRPGEEAFAVLPAPTTEPAPENLPRPVVRANPTDPGDFWQRVRDRLNFWD